MKTALVLSGGGANGAFQVGAISALKEKGYEFDIVAGVSVGSLNGALVAQNDYDTLLNIWQHVKERDVFRRFNYFQMAWRLLVQRKRSIYDATPLLELIRQYISLEKVKKSYHVGFTSLVDGKYHCMKTKDFYDSEQFQNAIYSSAVMPIIWEPIRKIVTKKETLLEGVDGGLHDVTPLSAVLDELPDRIYILSCNNGNVQSDIPSTIIDVVKRTFLDIMLNEVIRNDVQGLLLINKLVKQAEYYGVKLYHPGTSRQYKYFEVVHIQPEYKLGSPIDFSREKLNRTLQYGYRLAGGLKRKIL